MKSLMRPGATMLSSRSTRLTFEQKKKSLQQRSSFCNIKNKFLCVLLVIILVIILIFCVIYFDVASHATTQPLQPENEQNLIIEPAEPIKPSNDNVYTETTTQSLITSSTKNNVINGEDIAITSNTAYMSTLDIENTNFLNLLHRRSLGFALEDYNMMQSIISEYAVWANNMITKDIESGSLNSKYIIITPAAQMCNRMRAFMGSILLGILTRRIVFIDIGAEGYAARLNKIFITPGYQWEYKQIPAALRSLINTGNKQRYTFPYEWLEKNRAVSGVILNQICSDWINDKTIWQIESHAAYLPVMARNQHLYKAVIDRYKDNEDIEYKFDYNLAEYFVGKIGENGQEYMENLEVLLGRMLFKLEDNIQSAVDNLIKETYHKAMVYYESNGLDMAEYDGNDNPPPVIGIHIRSEYVLLMNPRDCPGHRIFKCDKPYHWFEDCGINAMDINMNLNGIKPYLYIAADTKDAQKAAAEIFGEERVYFRPFGKTGGSFEGIQEAVIDLISVSSFDVFVGTPHSSYSEMASILSEPRRIYNNDKKQYEFIWNMNELQQEQKHMIPVNRMIIPIMTNVRWEIDKLNLYTMGRTIDVNIDYNKDDDEQQKIIIPETNTNQPNYEKYRICKQTVTAGMGWMGLFNMLQNVQCYNKSWHHPGNKWFPIADK